MEKSTFNWRPWFIALSVILLVVSSISFFITNNIYDSKEFAEKTTNAVTTERSRDAIGREISTELLADQSLIAQTILTEPLTSLVSGLLNTKAFSGVFYEFSYGLNRFLTTKDFEPVTINIGNITDAINTVADALVPENDIDLNQQNVQEITLFDDVDLPPFNSIGSVLVILGPLALLSLAAVAVTSWYRMSDKKRMLKYSGIVMIITGSLLLVITYTSGALLTVNILDPERSIIMQEIYESFISGFRTYQFLTILVGITLWLIHHSQTNDIKFISHSKKTS